MSIQVVKKSDVSAAVNARKYVLVPGQIIGRKAVMKIPEKLLGLRFLRKKNVRQEPLNFILAQISVVWWNHECCQKGDLLNWNITRSDGSELVISVDRRNSNKY